MLTNLNPIVALWLIPVVLQIALPLTMLSGWLVMKVARKAFSAPHLLKEAEGINCRMVPTS